MKYSRQSWYLSAVFLCFLGFAAAAPPSPSGAGEVALPEEVQTNLDLLRQRLEARTELPPVVPGADPTLRDYQKLARERNLSLSIAEGTVRSAEDQLRADLAALLPQFDFNADYNRSRKEGTYLTQWLAQFTVNQPIWDGQLWGAYRQQRAQVSYSQFSRDHVQQGLDYEIAQAYYNLVGFNQSLEEYLHQVGELNDQLQVIQEMLAAGSKTKADLLRAENALQEGLNSLIDSADQAGLQSVEFNRILHLPPETRITIHRLGELELLLPEYDSCLARAYEQRPDIEQKQALIRVAEAGVVLAAQNFFPTIGLVGDYGWDYDDEKSDSTRRGWLVGATVTLPIFHSTQNWSLLAAARELERNARAALGQVRDLAAAEISGTLIAVSDAIVQIHLLSKNTEYAENLWEVEKELYTRGTILTSDLYETFTILLQARLSLINKASDYLTLMSRLQQAIGGGPIPPPLLPRGTVSITAPAPRMDQKQPSTP